MEWIVLLLLVAVVVAVVRSSNASKRRALEQRTSAELGAVSAVADEDVTRFGEELGRLDTELLTETLDEPARQDYQRALDSYEAAKGSLARASRAEDVRHVTEALEDGRYAVACVRARVAGEPLPTRRPPCFFNPAHGPSATDVDWAPPGGQQRPIPVCLADADRIRQGAEPDVRTVPHGAGRVPYWQGGRAYSPWASGYFGGYATSGLLPGFLVGSLLTGGFSDPFGAGFDGGYDGDAGDGYGGDGDPGDYSGGDGDYDSGGGWDSGGGFDGGDFGGGDFGGF